MLLEKGQWRVRVTRDVYEGKDIDEFRARWGKDEGERRFFEKYSLPDDRLRQDGNLLLLGGISMLFQYALGNGTASTGQTLTYLANATTWLGVGDSSTASTSTMTDLQASTNYYSNPADSTYPSNTSGSVGKTVTAATNAAPIQITATSHGYSTNDIVNVNGAGGNTAANGTWQVTVVDANNFTLNGSTGNSAWTSGGITSKNNILVVKSTFGTANGNFAWNEWVIRNNATKGSGTCLNRAVVSLGTKTSSASWALTVAPYLN